MLFCWVVPWLHTNQWQVRDFFHFLPQQKQRILHHLTSFLGFIGTTGCLGPRLGCLFLRVAQCAKTMAEGVSGPTMEPGAGKKKHQMSFGTKAFEMIHQT